jgi:GntR family transcriptional regulator, rspAB operon transcriptional repressor
MAGIAAQQPRLENLTLWERVYHHLRSEILDGNLGPGTELAEVALSEQLGVSRGPLREAIGRLAAEGLVTVRPRRGAVVRSL